MLNKIIMIIIKNLICIICSSLILSKYNIFGFMEFIPESVKYDIGLLFYMTIVQSIFDKIIIKIENRKVKIKCIFYLSDQQKIISNIPSIKCIPVATINCYIEILGNIKRLKKCKLYIDLPDWLSSQDCKGNSILSYKENSLNWDLSRMLSENSDISMPAIYDAKIYFISNNANENLTSPLSPKLNKKWGIKLETNSFIVKNGG